MTTAQMADHCTILPRSVGWSADQGHAALPCMRPLLGGPQRAGPQLLAACQQGKHLGLVLGLHSLAVCHQWEQAHLRSLCSC